MITLSLLSLHVLRSLIVAAHADVIVVVDVDAVEVVVIVIVLVIAALIVVVVAVFVLLPPYHLTKSSKEQPALAALNASMSERSEADCI